MTADQPVTSTVCAMNTGCIYTEYVDKPALQCSTRCLSRNNSRAALCASRSQHNHPANVASTRHKAQCMQLETKPLLTQPSSVHSLSKTPHNVGHTPRLAGAIPAHTPQPNHPNNMPAVVSNSCICLAKQAPQDHAKLKQSTLLYGTCPANNTHGQR